MKNLSMYRYTLLGMLAVVLLMFLITAASASTVRSQAAKREFARTHICPTTHRNGLPCPRRIIDHIEALACGGADKPSNMQYQTIAKSKAKDRIERIGCKGGKRITPPLSGAPA